MSSVKYKQDLPPKGGYGPLPYKRNLKPLRLSGYSLLGVVSGITYLGFQWSRAQLNVNMANKYEDDQAWTSLEPLLEAEHDRRLLRWSKEKIESEALNIVGAGYDPEYLPGSNEVMNNKQMFVAPIRTPENASGTSANGESKLSESLKWYYTRFENLVCGP